MPAGCPQQVAKRGAKVSSSADTPTRRERAKITAGAIAACTLWSSAFIFIKIGGAWMPPLQFAGWRFLFSGLVLLPWLPRACGCTWREIGATIARSWHMLVLLGLLQIGLKYAFFYIGLSFIPAALGAMLSGAGPLIVALVVRGVNREEEISGRMWGALLLGLLGVVTLTLGRQRMGAVGDWALLGIALILLNNVVSALGDIAVSKEKRGISPMLIASASLVAGGAGLLAVGIPVEGWVSPVVGEWRFYVSLVALCSISSIGFSIWFTLLKKPYVRVASLNFWKFLIPLFGAMLAWIVMPDEHPSLVAILGMAFIVGALLLFNCSSRQRG